MKRHMEDAQSIRKKQKTTGTGPKKRGRKPHGGVVISEDKGIPKINAIPNMVVHLKCKMSDVHNDISQIASTKYDPEVNQIVGYSDVSLGYEELESVSQNKAYVEDVPNDTHQNVLHRPSQNNISGRSKLCFYCGCGDRSIHVSIPISSTETVGKFCRPECAAGFLMKHTTNISIRHDQYQRLNAIYGTSEEQIRVAPEPYSLLEHYDGDMSSKEYHEMIGVCDVIQTNRLIRIIPRVVNETALQHNGTKDVQKTQKYQVRTVSNFFQKSSD